LSMTTASNWLLNWVSVALLISFYPVLINHPGHRLCYPLSGQHWPG
jgi:hypothetical protein